MQLKRLEGKNVAHNKNHCSEKCLHKQRQSQNKKGTDSEMQNAGRKILKLDQNNN